MSLNDFIPSESIARDEKEEIRLDNEREEHRHKLMLAERSHVAPVASLKAQEGKTMYSVEFPATCSVWATVEAESEPEAIEKAMAYLVSEVIPVKVKDVKLHKSVFDPIGRFQGEVSEAKAIEI